MNYKGGKINRDGYVYIKNWEHPNCSKQGYVAEHRLVMEKIIGRILEKSETVHHIDGDHANNNPENLQLFKTRGEHTRIAHPEIAVKNSKINIGMRRSVRTEFKKGMTPWNKK